MKKVETYLNEEEFKRFLKLAQAQGLTPYAFLKRLILDVIEK